MGDTTILEDGGTWVQGMIKMVNGITMFARMESPYLGILSMRMLDSRGCFRIVI